MKNYYKILGVPMSANAEELKDAYKALIKLYDPQLHANDRYCYERYQNITIAYNTLINQDKRNDYDRILRSILSPAELRALQREREGSQIAATAPAAATGPEKAFQDEKTPVQPLSPRRTPRPSQRKPFLRAAASLILLLGSGFAIYTWMGDRADNGSALAWNTWKASDVSPAIASETQAQPQIRPAMTQKAFKEPGQPNPTKEWATESLAGAIDELPTPASHLEAGSATASPKSGDMAEAASKNLAQADRQNRNPEHPGKKAQESFDESYAAKSPKPAKAAIEPAAATQPTTETLAAAEPKVAPWPLGTSQVEVLKKQGTPSTIVRYGADQETWLYLDGSIHFRNGRMISYNSEHQGTDFRRPQVAN